MKIFFGMCVYQHEQMTKDNLFWRIFPNYILNNIYQLKEENESQACCTSKLFQTGHGLPSMMH